MPTAASHGVHLVGARELEALAPADAGPVLSRGATASLEALAAAIAAWALLRLTTDESGMAAVLLALVPAVVAGVGSLAGRRRRLIRPSSLGAGLGFAGSALGTGMAVALLAQAAGLAVTPLAALAAGTGASAAAAAVSAVASRAALRERRILVVGTGVVARHLVTSLIRSRRGHVVGLLDDRRLPARPGEVGAQPFGDISDIAALIAENDIDLVVFSFVGTQESELSACVAACRTAGAEVAIVSRLFEGLPGELAVGRIEGYPVVSAGARRHGRGTELACRITDVVLASLALVLTAPLWILISITVVLDSPGGPIYRAPRIGRHGVPFRMLKFRKMSADAAGPALTLADDDRFTRVGKLLARSKLDELPQLWNVLRGQMSFVGPRPEDARYVAAQAEAYEKILTVRPGITGLSQIGFRREFEHLVGPDFEALYLAELLPLKVSIDMYYVDHRSWLTDLRIIAWTPMALLRGGELDIDRLASHVAFRRPARRRTSGAA